MLVRNHVNYNFCSKSNFVIPHVKTVYKGSDSLRYFGPMIWNLIPNELNIAIYLIIFYVKLGSENAVLALVDYAKTLFLTFDLSKKFDDYLFRNSKLAVLL